MSPSPPLLLNRDVRQMKYEGPCDHPDHDELRNAGTDPAERHRASGNDWAMDCCEDVSPVGLPWVVPNSRQKRNDSCRHPDNGLPKSRAVRFRPSGSDRSQGKDRRFAAVLKTASGVLIVWQNMHSLTISRMPCSRNGRTYAKNGASESLNDRFALSRKSTTDIGSGARCLNSKGDTCG